MVHEQSDLELFHLHLFFLSELFGFGTEREGGRERSGSVVECLTRVPGAPGSSLIGVTALWSLSKTHLF